MGFNKFANAVVERTGMNFQAWDEVRAKAAAFPGTDFAARKAARVVLQDYNPGSHLLTHCTIIASVDAEVSSEPLGRHLVDGFQIERKFADYLITPETSKYVNNNHDAWERKLLLACFRTFVGGENYVEHIQIPELSKGKIIDAAARDIGDSIYVDILVATDRKHKALVSAITKGELTTLSMGCQVAYTTCTKCGNTAEDETQLCQHVRYFKGSEFIDALGKKRKIAELCGHIKDEPGSVKFIEASWVANPAFTGAVMRNILSPEEAAAYEKRIQVAFSQPTRLPDPGMMQRAASLTAQFGEQDQGMGQGQGGQEAPAAPPAPKEKPLDKAVGDLTQVVRDNVTEKVRDEIEQDEAGKVRNVLNENQNETLIKNAMKSPVWRKRAHAVLGLVKDVKVARRLVVGLYLHELGGWGLVRAAHLTGQELLAVSRILDMASGRRIAGEGRIYRTVMAVHGTSPYPNVEMFLTACRQEMGRTPTFEEAQALILKGRVYDLGL